MKTQHTPGPWTFSESGSYVDARFYVSQADNAPYTPEYSDVATLVSKTCAGERFLIQQANARLIAAAPELLGALRLVMGCAGDINDVPNGMLEMALDDGDEETRNQANAFLVARAAITKATGVDQ
jgi:hypothetical protein